MGATPVPRRLPGTGSGGSRQGVCGADGTTRDRVGSHARARRAAGRDDRILAASERRNTGSSEGSKRETGLACQIRSLSYLSTTIVWYAAAFGESWRMIRTSWSSAKQATVMRRFGWPASYSQG